MKWPERSRGRGAHFCRLLRRCASRNGAVSRALSPLAALHKTPHYECALGNIGAGQTAEPCRSRSHSRITRRIATSAPFAWARRQCAAAGAANAQRGGCLIALTMRQTAFPELAAGSAGELPGARRVPRAGDAFRRDGRSRCGHDDDQSVRLLPGAGGRRPGRSRMTRCWSRSWRRSGGCCRWGLG